MYGVHLMVLAKLHRLSGSLEHLKLSVKELTEVGHDAVCVWTVLHARFFVHLIYQSSQHIVWSTIF